MATLQEDSELMAGNKLKNQFRVPADLDPSIKIDADFLLQMSSMPTQTVFLCNIDFHGYDTRHLKQLD